MNKSKFLKKSLAMLLAVMMVVAMIPLGASAAGNTVTINDGTIVDITSVNGKLEAAADENTFTDTLDYDETSEVIKVFLHANNAGGYNTVCYKLGDDVVKDETLSSGTATITISKVPEQGKSEQLVIFASKGPYDATKPVVSKNYTITLKTNNPSSKFDVKEATLTNGGDVVKGTVDNDKKDITFSMPWGVTSGTLAVTQEYPGKTPTATPTITVDNDPVQLNVYNQLNQRTVYTVSATEAECLTTLTVGGVAAEVKVDTEGKPVTPATYTVTLPEGTKVDGTGAAEVVKEKLNVVAKSAIDTATVAWNGAALDGKTVVVKTGAANTLTFTENGHTKSYAVEVSVKQSNDASVESVEVTANSTYAGKAFTEVGTPDGDKINVEMPYTSDVKNSTVLIKAAEGATVALEGGTAVNDATSGKPVPGKFTVDLSSAKRVTVTAADGTTKYYSLSVTVAENPNGNPTINAAKMTIGKDEYAATVSGTTITYSIPYAVTAAEIKAATFNYGKSFATVIDPAITWGADIFKDTNTITITSDDRTAVPYTVVFSLEAAKTGKTLSNVEFVNAGNAEDVTVDNTFTATVASNKITANLPYSYEKGTPKDDELVYQFELSEGAKLYRLDTTLTELKSGFYTEEEAKADETGAIKAGTIKGDTNTAAELAAKTPITYYVADETLVKLIKEGTVDETNITSKTEAKGHYTALTSAVKYDAAQTGFTLNSITDPDTKVTSKTNGNTAIEITVPSSYVTPTTKAFFPVIAASKMAKLEANGSVLLTPTKADGTNPGTQYMQVVDDGSGKGTYKLQLTGVDKDGNATGSTTDVTSIKVTNEAGTDDTTYAVTVKVAKAKTEALVKNFKVNSTDGVVDHNAKTIKVNLPANSDPTQVTLEATVSEMATISLYKKDGTVFNGMTAVEKLTTAKDTTTDITSVATVSVKAEDGKTTNTYTLTVTVNELKFTDVTEANTPWGYDLIMKAAAAGVVSGVPQADGTLKFQPNDNITRGAFASMVTRLMINNGLATQADVDAAKNPFKDSNVGYQGFNSSIGYLASKGIVSGKGASGNYDPNGLITRQEAAVIVSKALDLQTASTTKYTDDAKIASWAKTAVYKCREAAVMVGDGKTFNPTGNLTRAMAAVTLASKIK